MIPSTRPARLTDEEIFRLFSSIQVDIAVLRQEQDLNLVTLNRLNNSVEMLTDEMKNMNHVLKRMLRLSMAKGEKL